MLPNRAPTKYRSTSRHCVSLTVTLAVSFGVLMTAGVGSVLWFLIDVSRTTAITSVLNQSGLIVGAIIDEIDDLLVPAEDQAEFLAWTLEDGAVDAGDLQAIENLLLGALSAAPQVLSVEYFAPSGDVVEAHQIPIDHVGPDGTVSFALNFEYGTSIVRAEPGDAIVVAARGPDELQDAHWGPITTDSAGFTFVSYERPLILPDGGAAHISSTVTVNELSLLLDELSGDLDATAFVLAADQAVVAHPNLYVPSNGDGEQPTPTSATATSIASVGDPALAILPSARPDRGIPRWEMADREFRVLQEHVPGLGPVGFLVARLDGFSEDPWTVGAHFDAGLLTGDLRRTADALWVGLAILVVSIVAAILLARLIAAPIRQLADSAVRVGALDISAVTPVPPSRISELNDQSRAFNAMLDGLRWFEMYVPKSLVSRLVGHDGGVGSETRHLTVMFTDIVGFTGQAETLSADATARFLNEHFALVGGAVEAEGGTIDKFIGDALMAFWGAPDIQPDHADRAVRAGQAIVDAIKADNARRLAKGRQPVRLRIGIHTGPVIVGNIGAPGRINYTIVGDPVNVGQRLEALGTEVAPNADTCLLLSDETLAALSRPIATEFIGAYQVKGRTEPVRVHRPV